MENLPSLRQKPKRLPAWLKKRLGPVGALHQMKLALRERGLHTVCEEASCPNIGECWRAGTATFMILGDICTRHCGFCDVKAGTPLLPVDPHEPHALAEMVAGLNLSHVVITCVARDDLSDGGAAHFVQCIEAVRVLNPHTTIEILTTDFNLCLESIESVLQARPDVWNHNIETVRRLTPRVRHRATYENTLQFFKIIKEQAPAQRIKSGLMLGLGENKAEVYETLTDLRSVACELLTIGQYLRPSRRHLPVLRYIPPEEFSYYEATALQLGFRSVASGPFVRSSYHAERMV